MEYEIKNQFLNVKINSRGAELASVKSVNSDTEFLWQADPEVWNRHAPILFPIVGRLKNDTYQYQGKSYQLSQHGFARDKEFKLLSQENDAISLVLRDDEASLKEYPFHFELVITYRLLNNLLIEDLSVKNPSNEEMYFSIGCHPGFNIPVNDQLKKNNYYLQMFPSKDHIRIPISKETGLHDWAKRTIAATDTPIELNDELFKDDALVFELKEATKLSLRSEKTSYHINVTTENSPFIGVWSQYPKTANYVCIEPWWGLCDDINADGDISKKRGIIKLAPNEEWTGKITIALHE
ncbi:aldose 1-epimerase family protein [Lactobacillus jensenii]|jgi:aldose 1-epimerase family protein, lacX|uniref:Aldose 1-epimerase family protein n=2 Tax=Lactobacillus jensenii TaxID=109790 RepID=A0A5N1I991_LACJE|nr:aldose 1-epimerase family protein [Lactobacillus jensenii]ERJ43891.1 aldose 1-epimerase [Lactobacillus jensenii MD IIE-70(2)]APT14733.1 aldose epimerase [Lactobacillus jensenii]EEQ24026.1 aldose 1-epimerase [Lactobacillus jensenii 269-3]EEX27493.1 aldose 1-epimerase [Lactobacillus jensenii SJ-7A-US]KAA9234609.1 aldose 1-epimerase family protein [Lactobacillus jensenii]